MYATYAYDGSTGELTGIDYSDSTPDVSYTYSRASQVKTAGDATTGTHTFTYDSSKPWRLDREELPSYLGSRWLSPLYESSGMVGRAAGFQLGTSSTRDADLKREWQYESSTGRFDKVLSSYSGSNTRTFDYGYTTNSDLVGSLAVTNPGGGASPFSVARTYESNRDLVTQVQTSWSGSGTVAQFDYAYTSLGQRDWEKRGGSSFVIDSQTVTTDYQYNDRGEVTKALAYLGTQSDIGTAAKKMPNLQHEYAYDTAGNRTAANQTGDSGRVDSFTANSLNQLTARDNKTVIASGTVGNTAAVAVKVNSDAPVAADRQGSYWSKALTPGNSGGPDSADITLYAGQGSGVVLTSSANVAYVGQLAQTITHDADGNITGDGVWTYDWDAENRLIRMTAASGAVTAGFPNKKVEFAYDYANRRVQKVVSQWSSGSWSEVSAVRFIYDGWNLAAELSLVSSQWSVVRSYTWGLDVAGSLSATGGVGALLQVTQHAGTAASYLPAYDANGNVMALYDASTGTAAAIYEYSPFGELLRAEGTYARTNPIRFSSKFTDDETGLVYYGHRYYSPTLGRFISRDPIGEAGGLNLYGFCDNDGVNDYDVLGLAADPPPRPWLSIFILPGYDGRLWWDSWTDRRSQAQIDESNAKNTATRKDWEEAGAKLFQLLAPTAAYTKQISFSFTGSKAGDIPISELRTPVPLHEIYGNLSDSQQREMVSRLRESHFREIVGIPEGIVIGPMEYLRHLPEYIVADTMAWWDVSTPWEIFEDLLSLTTRGRGKVKISGPRTRVVPRSEPIRQQLEQQQMTRLESDRPLVYKPYDFKHGAGRFGSTMDLSPDAAQGALRSSVLAGKQRYAYVNGKLYEFKYDNAGSWHGYPIPGNEAPPAALKELLQRGDITQTEYKQLLKGKR